MSDTISKRAIIREMGVQELGLFIEELEEKYEDFLLPKEELDNLIFAKQQLIQMT